MIQPASYALARASDSGWIEQAWAQGPASDFGRSGHSARARPSGTRQSPVSALADAVAYVLLYRTVGRRQRWYTIGRHGAPWTPDSARAEARRVLGQVAQGADPSANKQVRRHAVT